VQTHTNNNPCAEVSVEQLQSAIAILGCGEPGETAIAARIAELVGDPTIAMRLSAWIPEVFGIVLASHLGRISLPKTFSAKSSDGEWLELELDAEPIFKSTLPLALAMFHSGPRDTFHKVAVRSSVLLATNNLLNAGGSLDGATLSGPALIGIAAEIYLKNDQSLWRRLRRWF
jgi:hypothetical protein